MLGKYRSRRSIVNQTLTKEHLSPCVRVWFTRLGNSGCLPSAAPNRSACTLSSSKDYHTIYYAQKQDLQNQCLLLGALFNPVHFMWTQSRYPSQKILSLACKSAWHREHVHLPFVLTISIVVSSRFHASTLPWNAFRTALHFMLLYKIPTMSYSFHWIMINKAAGHNYSGLVTLNTLHEQDHNNEFTSRLSPL